MGRNAETYRIVPVYPLPIRAVSHLKMMLLRRRHGIPQEYQDLRIDPQPLFCWLGPVGEAVPVASAAPCLQWKDDGDRVEVFRLDADEVFVGRREDAGLVLRHPEVSRRHARIYRDAEGIVIADLESTHGTWVNGMRISRHLLRSGDRIRFGVNGPEVTLRTDAADSGSVDSLHAMDRAVEQFSSISPLGATPQSAIAKLSNLLELQYSFAQNFLADGVAELGRTILHEVDAFTRGAMPNDDLTFVVIHRGQ